MPDGCENNIVMLPLQSSMTKHHRCVCRDIEEYKLFPELSKSPQKKSLRKMRNFIYSLGLALDLVTDEAGNVLGGWKKVLKAKKEQFDCLISIQVDGLTPAEKHAFVIAYKEFNSSSGGKKK